MSDTDTVSDSAFDYDVVIVGGGPAGCSAGVFTARYGLETAIFDRGRSSIQRCGYLENYLGFPAGIDIETFYELIHDHAEEVGCEVVPELVEAVSSDERGFVVETQDGDPVTTERVVAAARYDAEFLRPLDEGTMFETYDHDGETHERFDREYPDEGGSTPIAGLYVAAPAHDAEAQAIMSAGHGARVARTVLADVRRSRGFPDEVAAHWDWIRSDRDLTDEWADRETWREWFDGRVPADHALNEEHFVELREREIDRRFETYLSDEAIEQRIERGHRRLLDHLDDDLVLEKAREIKTEREGTKTNG
ncbi:NAD(P)/FAD-dependent oxidoreductase [Halalkalicoccus jeotgali]|uniref:Thioredoxin reductase n=1 Tax=Halalkalicoccus jeotgali (strain DSM 18796 / CECT 7217 / JCM 14584 / KCTC 4019 / B3) TaxID=795797 RepID=D8J6L2_HALJB|nr:NAD(P)/FAD-dependent oxidoreductase [Halalkalicoccus jeotgali]ADJ13889.1 thioredoxin reductase [Halalkalicoccus jeotgali B3]ELY34064.1 thioredoxin reductase [Halalkalicoccus jeotgali B3]